MLIGYARVSTSDQRLDLQQDALRGAGCERIFTDSVSGAKTERLGLTAALDACRAGDILVVWKLDRLGRSLAHLVATVEDLAGRSVGFRSLQEQLDTTTMVIPGCQSTTVEQLLYVNATVSDETVHPATAAERGPAPAPRRAAACGVAPQTDPHRGPCRLWQNHAPQRLGR